MQLATNVLLLSRPRARTAVVTGVPAAALLLSLLAAAPAAAQNSTTPGTLQTYPTLSAAGARLSYGGDDNSNASARLEWRRTGDATWQPGLTMTRITGRRFAASLFWLDAATSYDVRAIVTDPDGGGGTVTATTLTRSQPSANVATRTWWVSLTGNDTNSGTLTAPLRTLQAAADRARAGDEIHVLPGIYYESVEASVAGTSSAPIRLVADFGAILDGADPAFLHRTDWRNDGGGVYSVPFTGTTRLVSADQEQRLYHHATVTDLRAGSLAIPQGWVIEGGRLSVRLEDGSSPALHTMYVARLDVGVWIQASHWEVRGFEIRHFGTTIGAAGIYLRGANQCVIADNLVHTIGGNGIYLRVLAADNLIERNRVEDYRIGGWPWNATKAHEEEQQGISHRGGRGNVIRWNSIRGTFDGIDVSGGETDENVGADTDIHDNIILGVGDDALEPESIAGINVRVWNNRVDGVFNGVSIAPNTVGPTYVIFNTITNYRRGGLKFSLSGTGQTWFFHNTISSSVAGAAALHPTGPYSNMHFRNNILVGNGSAAVTDDAGESLSGCDFDGDLLYSTTSTLFRWKGVNYGSLGAVQTALGYERAGRAGDPRFVAATTGDFSLASGSPAIDAALVIPGINDRFNGSAPDMGAREFGSDLATPAPILDLKLRTP